MKYLVNALDLEGKSVKMVLEAENENEILNILRSQNLYVLDLKPLPKVLDFLYSINPIKFKKIKAQEIIELFENLHLIVKAGVPLTSGLKDLEESIENKKLKSVLKDIHNAINNGVSISDAFKRHENIFGPVITTLIKIGEETGGLDKVLKDAANYLGRIEDIKSKTKQALIYPGFTFVAIFGTMIFWMVYVLPKMIEAFKNFNIELPITTRILIAMSDFTRKYIVFIIIGIIILFGVLKFLRKTNPKVKLYTDKVLLKLPIIGVVLTYFNYAFMSEYLKLMIKAGVSISRALEILGKSLNNEVFRLAVEKARESINNGNLISNAFKEQQLFSPMIIRMLNIGENTGSLEEQLDYIAGYYYNKVDYISQNMAKLIEPLLLTFVGIFMLILILGLMGPIYNLISTVGKQG